MQSEHVNELFGALSKVQGEIKPALKDAANPFFKSKYADLTSIWECCRDALARHGLCVSQSIMIQDGVTVLVTILGHASGQWIKSVAPIITTKPDIQAFGSSTTYMRRYSLSALVGICTDDDDGESTMDRSRKEEPKPAAKVAAPSALPPVVKITGAQVAEYNELYGQLTEKQRKNVSEWLKGLGYDLPQNIAQDFFTKVKTRLQATIEQNKAASELEENG